MRKTLCPLLALVALLVGGATAANAAPTVGVNITGGATGGGQVPAAVGTGATTVRVFVLYQGGTVLDPAILNAYDGIVNGIVASGRKAIIVVSGFGAPPASVDDFATFMGNLAQHYGNRVMAWEVWNEEDEALWWGTAGGNPMAYAGILRAVYPKVHPYATVLLGPLTANNFVFLGQVYAALGGSSANAFDAVAVHTDTACSLASPDDFQRTPDGHIGRFSFLGLLEVRRVMVENGDGGKSIWVTELGWNTYQGTCTHGAFAGQKAAGVSEADQAKFLTLAYHCLRQLPYVSNALWFDLVDQGGDSLYGLLRGDGSQKPSYGAFAEVAAGRDALAGQSCGDFDPPAIKVREPDEGSNFKAELPIDVTATDSAGVARITLLADGVKIRNFTGATGAAAQAYPGTRRAVIEWQGAKDLRPGPHTIQVIAIDGRGNTSSKDIHVVKGGAAAPPPIPGKTGGVDGISGRVCFYKPGSKRCIRLHGGETIPVGSIIDTTNGKITLVVSDGKGGTDTGLFSGGAFLFTQELVDGELITNLKLQRGKSRRKICGVTVHKSSVGSWPGAFADTARRRVIRYLNAKAHGNFNVIGKHASGAERGTVWKVTDTCTATEVKVISGVVDVLDFFKKKHFFIKAGHTYVANGKARRRR